MAAWFKTAAAMGSALPDPVKDQAALSPVPQQAIENKPAPGQTGPKGMAPRTTYSRVNTGSPPVMDAGAMAQKSGPNRGMEFLPAKLAAQRGFMTTIKERPLLQELVKAAMAGTSERLSVNLEAARQAQHGVKTASAVKTSASASGHVSTEFATKLAHALGFIEQQLLKEADLMPGEGPGALQVLEATSSEKNIDAGESGQATSQNQPPQTPSLQPEKVQQGNAGTGLQTNDDMSHPEQPVEPIKNASALAKSNLVRLEKVAKKDDPKGHHFRRAVLGNPVSSAIEARKGEKLKALGEASVHGMKEQLKGIGVGGAVGAAVGAGVGALKDGKKGALKGALAGGGIGALGGQTAGAIKGTHGSKASEIHAKRSKHGSVPLQLIRKLAEDAINPAQISSARGQDPMSPPDGASPSEEGVPSEPADVTSQKSMISSNEAAINYTKGQAKADPKKDVAQVLAEPPLSSATDKVLERAFDSTGKAGVKISSAGGLRKTAQQVGATRVLLGRLLKEANEHCGPDAVGKDKKSMGMAPATPQAATGANAATMGQ